MGSVKKALAVLESGPEGWAAAKTILLEAQARYVFNEA